MKAVVSDIGIREIRNGTILQQTILADIGALYEEIQASQEIRSDNFSNQTLTKDQRG